MSRSYRTKFKKPKVPRPLTEEERRADEGAQRKLLGREIDEMRQKVDRLLNWEGLASLGAVTKVLEQSLDPHDLIPLATIKCPGTARSFQKGEFWIKNAPFVEYLNPLDPRFWERDLLPGGTSNVSYKGNAYNITQYGSTHSSSKEHREPDWVRLTSRFQQNCYFYAYPGEDPCKGLEGTALKMCLYDEDSPRHHLRGPSMRNGDMLCIAENYMNEEAPLKITFYRFFREGRPMEGPGDKIQWLPWITTSELRECYGQVTWRGQVEAEGVPDVTDLNHPWNFGENGDLYHNEEMDRFQIRLDVDGGVVWRHLPKFFYYNDPEDVDRDYTSLYGDLPGDLMYDIEKDIFLGRYEQVEDGNVWRPIGGSGGTCWKDYDPLPAQPEGGILFARHRGYLYAWLKDRTLEDNWGWVNISHAEFPMI